MYILIRKLDAIAENFIASSKKKKHNLNSKINQQKKILKSSLNLILQKLLKMHLLRAIARAKQEKWQ